MSAVMKDMPEPEKKKPASALIEKRMQEREHKVTDFVVDVESHVKLEDLEDPAFWAFVAPQLKMGDAIEVRPDDMSWIASYRVIWAERNFARVLQVWFKPCKFNMEAPIDSIKHKVEFKGGTNKWCVIRLADNEIIYREIATRDEANAKLKNHEVVMGAGK
jgi:hypothetical protein